MSRKLIWIALFSLVAIVTAAPRGEAASAPEIDAGVSETLDRFFYKIGGARELAHNAVGILVFPSVVKAGFGVGGEYGEGALRIRGRTAGYYNTLSASFGFQLGVQARSVVIMFMTEQALNQFRRTAGWKVGSRRLDRDHHGGDRRIHRYQQDHEPRRRLHPRSQGPDV